MIPTNLGGMPNDNDEVWIAFASSTMTPDDDDDDDANAPSRRRASILHLREFSLLCLAALTRFALASAAAIAIPPLAPISCPTPDGGGDTPLDLASAGPTTHAPLRCHRSLILLILLLEPAGSMGVIRRHDYIIILLL
jgi:hypothetical protein